MNRNIITVAEAATHNLARAAEVRRTLERYASKDRGRRAGLERGTLGGELPIDMQKPDAWYDRILKYVPVEAVSVYLALDRVISASGQGFRQRETLLALALLCSVAFNIAYLVRIAGVASPFQVAVSTVALIVYVYVNSGVFALLGVAPPIAQLLTLIVTGAVLTFVEPPPLTPKDSSALAA